MLLAAIALSGAALNLAPLLDRLRLSVPDARAITDLQVCPPTNVSDDGSRATTMVAFNRPREPRRYYRVTWRDGRADSVNDSGVSASNSGLAGLASAAMEKRMQGCAIVSPDALNAAWHQLDNTPR